MTEDYVPTLGEYAEIIEWLVTNPNDEIPKHMRRVFDDAMERAGMRRFARSMEDAVEYALGYRPPEWQMQWLNADFSASDAFRASLDAARVRLHRDDVLNQRLLRTIEQAISTDVIRREATYTEAVRLTREDKRHSLYLAEHRDGNGMLIDWSVACTLPGGSHATVTFTDEILCFDEDEIRANDKKARRWFSRFDHE